MATDDFTSRLITDDGTRWLHGDILTSLKAYATGAGNQEITTDASDFALGLLAIHPCQGAFLLCLALDILPKEEKKALKLALKQETPDFVEILNDEIEGELLDILLSQERAKPSTSCTAPGSSTDTQLEYELLVGTGCTRHA